MSSLTMLPPSADSEAATLRAFKRGEPITPELQYATAWSVGRGFVVFYPSIVGAGMFAVLSPDGRLRLDEIARECPERARGLRLVGPRCNIYPPAAGRLRG
jgi:hypothetical protein